MVTIPQALQNTPLANMSAAQNSHESSLIVQSQPMEIPSNSQPLQGQQRQPTTCMQSSEPRHQKRTKRTIKMIDPVTGIEIDLHNNTQKAPVR